MTTIEQNRREWIDMLENPANQYRQGPGLLGDSDDECCALGLWVRERHADLVEEYLNLDWDQDTRGIGMLYDAALVDLDLNEDLESLVINLNDTSQLPFADIARELRPLLLPD